MNIKKELLTKQVKSILHDGQLVQNGRHNLIVQIHITCQTQFEGLGWLSMFVDR